MDQRMSFAIVFLFLACTPLCLCTKANSGYLYPQFYDHSCPKAQEIVKSILAKAVIKEIGMAGSLQRLFFLDCMNKGCDASILLDSSDNTISEKRSNPSARVFEVIDEIKSALEEECSLTVSCADVLALAARDSVVLTGGPSWEVPLGRRDSRDASLSGSNNNIPAANDNFETILAKFKLQGLNVTDLVTLSVIFDWVTAGSHAVGNSRSTSFSQRLYNQLQSGYPRSGGDENLSFLDSVTPEKFDNNYYKDILASKGLLNSDQILLTKNEAIMELVEKYAENIVHFFEQFVKSMVKMGNHSPLTGDEGEIRKNCRKIN